MKKKIMLVLTLGISFGPSALAVETGQDAMSKTPMVAVRCAEREAKQLPAKSDSSEVKSSAAQIK